MTFEGSGLALTHVSAVLPASTSALERLAHQHLLEAVRGVQKSAKSFEMPCQSTFVDYLASLKPDDIYILADFPYSSSRCLYTMQMFDEPGFLPRTV